MTLQGINIFSGSSDPLGAALTNPTELARKKGAIKLRYPLAFAGRSWPDVEAAYLAMAGCDETANDQLMGEMIAAKLRQHPALLEAIDARGGMPFLLASRHWTAARTSGFQAWEGDGLASRFIRNLVTGYTMAQQPVVAEQGQFVLNL